MQNKLMLVTVSGVQNFIANARKTVDFYNGSSIIIEYLRKIYRIIKDHISCIEKLELLLPSRLEDESYDIPNYFLLNIISSEENNDTLEKKVRNNLKNYINDLNSSNEILKFIDLNVYIIIVDYTDNDYKKAYKNLYRKLDSYKNDKFKDRSLINYNIDKDKKRDNCTVCEIRRGKYISENNPFVKNKADYEFKGECYKKCYDDILCESCFQKRINKTSNEKQRYSSVVSIADNNSSYYALIKADIDDLGKHFSGKYLDEKKDLLNFQKEMSGEILEFGKRIKDKIRNTNFKNELYIYSGGDDLLLFSPLSMLFKFIESIDEEFKELADKRKLSLSKSIVISHTSIPLKKVINLSRISLEKTKEKFKNHGKCALALSLIDSSCNVRITYLKDKKENIKAIDKLVYGFENHISHSLIYDVERQISLLGENMDFEEYVVLKNIMDNIIQIVGSRKIPDKNNCEKYVSKMKLLFSEFVHVNSTDYYMDINGYFNLLHIIDKYSRETGYVLCEKKVEN
ncbi:Cas10/Cmr2 second palm domain-containing protein [Clostridium sp. HV4-5-A1G]|uniref:Cas10/Cmr2 second palm domain-containing protein n=1 Tax=Clostridium sp. HV4-5-A1G TaxID=2004595 RepID=UPI0012384359|nr:type III-B CRISPR-associated protein Cas10/Cmr2 [Clostridium sp. HV4-5-A1G]KAA8675359.1 hypothetical protein F3O63_04855 [Clostridium sp. HV4-5-A1G]